MHAFLLCTGVDIQYEAKKLVHFKFFLGINAKTSARSQHYFTQYDRVTQNDLATAQNRASVLFAFAYRHLSPSSHRPHNSALYCEVGLSKDK